MVIRTEQLIQLERVLSCQFDMQVLRYLRHSHPEETRNTTDQELQEVIRKNRLAAERYGISDETDLVRYIQLALSFGTGFEVRPEMSWARSILCDTRLLPEDKLDLITEQLLFK